MHMCGLGRGKFVEAAFWNLVENISWIGLTEWVWGGGGQQRMSVVGRLLQADLAWEKVQ